MANHCCLWLSCSAAGVREGCTLRGFGIDILERFGRTLLHNVGQAYQGYFSSFKGKNKLRTRLSELNDGFEFSEVCYFHQTSATSFWTEHHSQPRIVQSKRDVVRAGAVIEGYWRYSVHERCHVHQKPLLTVVWKDADETHALSRYFFDGSSQSTSIYTASKRNYLLFNFSISKILHCPLRIDRTPGGDAS